ncbi:MAG: regulator [Rhizobacter sp.]|nr:regulator [Ferruginibacter sp.]
MIFSRYCCLLLLLTLLTTELPAQLKEVGLPFIKNYTRFQYKGDTQNWCIDQDSNDHIYFANNAGLFQFDGSTWNKYNMPNHPSVRSLKIGDSGKIYVGGYNELGYFKADEKGALQYNSLLPLLNENIRGQIDFIWKIHQFQNELVFQTFERAYIFNGKTFRLLEAPNRFQFSFIVKNRLYFQDASLGLLEFKNNALVPLNGTASLNTAEVWGMLSLGNDSLLIATQNKGIFIYTDNNLLAWKSAAGTFLKKNGCLGATIIQKKFFVFNSVLAGVIICDISGNIIQHIHQKKGLQNNTILTSFIDTKNNLWLGLDNGIDFINESTALTYLGAHYNLGTVYASVIYKNNFYVATNQGLFYRPWNKDSNETLFSLVEGTTGQAWNIQVIDESLICSHNRGLLLIQGNKTSKTLDKKGYWGIKQIAGHADLFLASQYTGFSVFKKKQQSWQYRNDIEGFNKSSNTFELEGDDIWMIKDDLLYQLRVNHDITRFKLVKSFSELARDAKGISIISKLGDHLYFKSRDKFYSYSSERDTFTENKKLTSLFDSIPQIRFIYEDKGKNIWYVSNEALGMFKRQSDGSYQNIVTAFTNLKGSLVMNYTSINVIDNQNVFIGLTNGMAHFNSSLADRIFFKPRVHIRSFSFGKDTFFFGNNSSGIPVKHFSVPYKSNNVKFIFSSPMYQSPENIEFSYQLAGFSDGWSAWTPINFKEYTNLPEGKYAMHVKVRNSFGVVSNAVVIHFNISPPFYRHIIAYCLYILAGLGIIYFTRLHLKSTVKKQHYYETIEQRKVYLEKEARIKAEQHELEKAIEELEIEKLQINLLSKDRELVNNSFQVVKQNKLLNSIIQKIKNINDDSVDESTQLQLNKLVKTITKELNTDKSWEELEKHIKNVHFDFLRRLKSRYPGISSRELDLSTYLLLNMSSKEIAAIMNISSAGVELARYRLRKKIGLSREENLVSFLMSI